MGLFNGFRVKAFTAMVGVGVVAAACTSATPTPTATRVPPTATPTATATRVAPTATPTSVPTPTAQPADMGSGSAAMMMQPGADKMKVSLASPADGTKATGNSVTLQVTATGYDLTCDLAGKPDQEGKGHYHVLLDKSLINMFCTPTATVSLQNVKPGVHTLAVVPAQNNHAEVEENAAMVSLDYEPTAALPVLKDVTFPGKPTIKIVSPKAGDTVTGNFDVVVQVQNYNLSCDLYGKPAVLGYGHWHLNLDSTSGPMMGMGTMAGMSCETIFHASTAGLQAGSTHTLIAQLEDNGHAPLMPEIADEVEVHIK